MDRRESMDSPVLEAEYEVEGAEEEMPPEPGGRSSQAVAVRPAARDKVSGLLSPVADLAEVMELDNQTRGIIEQYLEEERDYGTISSQAADPEAAEEADQVEAEEAIVKAEGGE